ncbi:MAG: hypothetical protein E7187_00935 [Erysipelotrichaceae bacterium]|nr:hypothetical protein [Erysipelotrichaceae bacterium]
MIRAYTERQCVTPDYTPFYLTGYKSPIRKLPAQGVHDDIYVQMSLFDINGTLVFLYSTDWISVEEGFYQELSGRLNTEFGIDKKLVLVSATHNHQSVGDQMKRNEHFNQKYYDWLIELGVEAVRKGLNNLREVKVFYGKKVITGYYASRVLDNTLADNEVILVEFRDSDNKVVSAICNWAVHSTAVTPENALLTGEFAGNTAREYCKLKGYYPHMIVGAAGDCSTRNTRQGNDFAELERISKGMAEEISGIPVDRELHLSFNDIRTITHHVDVTVDHDDVRRKIADAEEELKTATDFDRIKVLKSMMPALNKLLSLDRVVVDWFADSIRLGDLQIIVTPAELASKFGLQIKNASKTECCLIFGYTNGKAGYLFPEELYGMTFETISSGVPAEEVQQYINKIMTIV